MNLKPRLDLEKVLLEPLKQQIHQLQLMLRFIAELKEPNRVSKIHTPLFSPLDEGNSCNLREGEGETSGIVEANPPPPEIGSLVILEGEGILEIPDIGSTIKSPKGPRNQPP